MACPFNPVNKHAQHQEPEAAKWNSSSSQLFTAWVFRLCTELKKANLPFSLETFLNGTAEKSTGVITNII